MFYQFFALLFLYAFTFKILIAASEIYGKRPNLIVFFYNTTLYKRLLPNLNSLKKILVNNLNFMYVLCMPLSTLIINSSSSDPRNFFMVLKYFYA